jgi:hypothetical protein
VGRDKRKQGDPPLPAERLDVYEYACDCCKTVFYADYGVVERCCVCGSTSEVVQGQNLRLLVERRYGEWEGR